MVSITEQLVSGIRRKPVTDADLEFAALLVLDNLANSIAGSVTEAGWRIIKWGREQGYRDAGRLAFAMSVLSQITEMDDIHARSSTHPGSAVIPASMASAFKEGITGHSFLHSVLHGYEAICLIGQALNKSEYRSIDHSSICGSFGSAMAVSQILNLTDRVTAAVLFGLIAREVRRWDASDAGSLSKYLNRARASESGVVAGYLARTGLFGEGRVLNDDQGFWAAVATEVRESEGEPWALTQTTIRTWPCCRHTHPALEAAIQLHRSLAGKSIREVRVITYQTASDLCDRPHPVNEYDAKFSIQHCVAAALLSGDLEWAAFDDDCRASLAGLRNRIVVQVGDEFSQRFPVELGAKVIAKLDDGTECVVEAHCHKTNADIDLVRNAVKQKARLLLESASFSGSDVKDFFDIVLNLRHEEKVVDVTNWFF